MTFDLLLTKAVVRGWLDSMRRNLRSSLLWLDSMRRIRRSSLLSLYELLLFELLLAERRSTINLSECRLIFDLLLIKAVVRGWLDSSQVPACG